DVVGLAQVAKRVQRRNLRARGFEVAAVGFKVVPYHWCPDEAGVYRVHADPVGCVEQGVGLAHQPHRALGSVVGRRVWRAHQAVDRGQVDDAAALGAPQVRHCVLDGEENAFDVDRLYAIPFSLAHLVGGLVGAGDAGIVDQYTEATEAQGDGVDGIPHLTFISDIDVPVLDFVPGHAQFVTQHGPLGIEDVEQREAGTFARQPKRAGTADSQRRAGDDASFALDTIHGDFHSWSCSECTTSERSPSQGLTWKPR